MRLWTFPFSLIACQELLNLTCEYKITLKNTDFIIKSIQAYFLLKIK